MASDLIKSGWNGWQKEATLATLVVRARFFPAAASHASIRGGSVFERETAGCWLLAIILCLVETRNPKKKTRLLPSGQLPHFTSFVVNFNGPPAIFV